VSISEFERLLAAALPTRCRTAITLTELPTPDELFDLLDRAIIDGDRCGAPLVEIHAPQARYALDGAWRHAVVEDHESVLRLVFEPHEHGPLDAAPRNGPPQYSMQAELGAG
jgi:hypothetical protein